MKRKHFLSSAAGLFAAFSVSGRSVVESMTSLEEGEALCTVPPFLKSGDIIGITSPAGYISVEQIQPAVKQLQNWGFRVKVGDAIGKRDFTFGGSDEERLTDLQKMLDDDSVKAILCARGGYGVVRIIDRLDFEKFSRKPKWILGFSDITMLLAHVNTRCRVAGIHSKMCNSFLEDPSLFEETQRLSIASIFDCLSGKKMNYEISPSASNRTGNGEGELVGGNLRLIETITGTRSDINTRNKILFLEDTEEYLYNIDRMFWNLKRSGKLNHLKGLIIGGFKTKPDDPGEEFGLSVEQIVLEKVKGFSFPVCFGFPVGHQKHNMALRYGMKHRLVVTANGSVLETMGKDK